MAVSQPADEENEDDETPYAGVPSVGLAGGRAARPRSPLVCFQCVLTSFYLVKLDLLFLCLLCRQKTLH